MIDNDDIPVVGSCSVQIVEKNANLASLQLSQSNSSIIKPFSQRLVPSISRSNSL